MPTRPKPRSRPEGRCHGPLGQLYIDTIVLFVTIAVEDLDLSACQVLISICTNLDYIIHLKGSILATRAAQRPDRADVLGNPIIRIARLWELSNAKLGSILGLSSATASRLRHGQARLDPASTSFEAGQFLLRLFRGLDALVGSDDDASRRWLAADNLDLDGRPFDRLDTMRGLIEVCEYVDFYRVRV